MKISDLLGGIIAIVIGIIFYASAGTLPEYNVKLAGPVLEKRFRVDGDTAIFEGRDVLQLGDGLEITQVAQVHSKSPVYRFQESIDWT